MPMFVVLQNKVKKDSMSGSNESKLEQFVRKHAHAENKKDI